MSQSHEPLVTIAQYSQAHDGRVAKVILESAGIPVALADEHINALRGSLNAIPVRVQVPQSAAAAARALLSEHETPGQTGPEADACPQCGSGRTRACRGRIAALLASLFFGLPLMRTKRLECADCNHRWSTPLTL